MRSLRTRVVLAAAAVLAVFVLLTSLALERAFRDAAESAREERLLSQLFLLMAAAEAEDGVLVLPKNLTEPRFGLPQSGLYAAVLDEVGQPVWRSASTMGIEVPLTGAVQPGRRVFERRAGTDGNDYFVARFGVTWATGTVPTTYTFAVAEDLAPYRKELARFRTALAGWLAAMSFLMLGALLLAMRWGLLPLRRVAHEVAAIELGRQERIKGDYPTELRSLSDNLNALLAHERSRQKRLDNALGDLAHSLKTPLSVMRGALNPDIGEPERVATLQEQIARMDQLVAYQLQRARSRAGAAAGLSPRAPVAHTAERLGASLAKVYRDKSIDLELDIDPSLTFGGTEGDLLELLGNLMDNACKWARGRVRVSAAGARRRLVISVEDDGPGISAEQTARVLERGVRADESAPGHGIGLAVVREICEAHGGTLEIGRSPLGGAAVSARMAG
jgi:two-component system sensor histidine kinase PhoQ